MAESSEDPSNKTEEPSGKRLADARAKGEVAKSQEIIHWMMIGASALVVGVFAPGAMNRLAESLVPYFSQAHLVPADASGIGGVLLGSLLEAGGVLLVPFAILIVAGILASVVQTGGFLFTTEQIQPKLSKISPIAGFQRLFSMQSLMEFTKGILKLAIVSIVGIWVMMPEFNTMVELVQEPAAVSLHVIYDLTMQLLMAVLSIMAVVAALDFLLQRRQYMQKMRMSRQELKDEYKQTEGDPVVKARLRQLRMEKSRRRMMAAVPKADVIVTNPTHFAVALKYDQKEMDAPMVVAKGVDLVAFRIREIAKEHRIPIVENKPLARALYASAEIDEEIPAEHYKAVAEVISYVFGLRKKKAKR
jgi:flagellar biosynthetic protein FlhB